MANSFIDIAKALSESQTNDSQNSLNELKLRKKSLNNMLDIAISQEELKKAEMDAQKNQIKYEEKKAKIKAELLKGAVEQQVMGSVAVGGNMLSRFAGPQPQVAPEAEGLPMIDRLSQSI